MCGWRRRIFTDAATTTSSCSDRVAHVLCNRCPGQRFGYAYVELDQREFLHGVGWLDRQSGDFRLPDSDCRHNVHLYDHLHRRWGFRLQ